MKRKPTTKSLLAGAKRETERLRTLLDSMRDGRKPDDRLSLLERKVTELERRVAHDFQRIVDAIDHAREEEPDTTSDLAFKLRLLLAVIRRPIEGTTGLMDWRDELRKLAKEME